MVRRRHALNLVLAGSLGLWSAPAWADSLCADKALQIAADAQIKRAEELERAGKPYEAYAALRKRTWTASPTLHGRRD